MLSFFRGSGVGKFLVAAIAFAIIVVFAVEFRAGRGAGGANLKEECSAEVYGYCVRPKEYFASFGLATMGQLSNTQLRELSLPERILDGLVERELLVHEAEALGLDVGENDVNAELEKGRIHVSLPAAYTSKLAYYFGLCVPNPRARGCDPGTEGVRGLDVNKNGKFDYERYVRNIRVYANRSPKEFKEMQEREVIASRVRTLVRSRVRVSDAEAFRLYERERSKAVARVVALHASWFARYALAATDTEVDDWASEHKAEVDAQWKTGTESFKAGCPLAREILFETSENATDEDKAIKRTEAEEAKRRLDKGEDFVALARELSDGAEAELGGMLGCVTDSYGAGAQSLLGALGKLKAGDTSPIVDSVRGFHLLKYEGPLAQGDVEGIGRREVARKLFVASKSKDLAKSFATELIAQVKQGAKMDAATDTLARRFASSFWTKEGDPPGLGDDKRPKVEVSSPFAVTGNVIADALASENAAVRVFDLEKTDMVVAEPIATFDGFAVAQLKEKNPVTRAEYDKQRGPLLRSLTEARADDALVRYVAELRSRLGEKLKIDQAFIDAQTKHAANSDN